MKCLLPLFIAFTISKVSTQTVDSTVIKQINNLIEVSYSLTSQKKFEKAYEVISGAEKLVIEKMGRESFEYGRCCFMKGWVNDFKKDYHEAEKWYLEAKSIQVKVIGNEHPDYIWTLYNLGYVYERLLNYEKAESLYLEGIAIREKVLGKDHPYYLLSLNLLVTLYEKMMRYENAESLYLEGKTIREKVLGKDHLDYIKNLNDLGSLYFKMGNYEKAEMVCLEAKKIQEKMLDKEHSSYAFTLNELALIYHAMGNYKKAELFYIEAKAIIVKVFGMEHPDYTSILNNLASNFYMMGNLDNAELHYIEALNIRKKVTGKKDLDYRKIQNNLASIYFTLGKYDKAEQQLLESKAGIEKALGKLHPDYVGILINLGGIKMVQGNYEKAETLIREAKAIWEKDPRKERPIYTAILNYLVNLFEMQNRFSESEPLIKELYSLIHDRLVKATSFLSEQELAQYTSSFQKSGDDLSGFLLNRSAQNGLIGNLPGLVFDHVLFYKGFLLNAVSRLNSTANISHVSSEIDLRLRSYRRLLSVEYVKPIVDRKLVTNLEDKANLAEKELARSVAGYNEAIQQVGWQDVQALLKETDAVIEFISFKVNFPRKTDSIMYAALLLKSGDNKPLFISLFEEKYLDSLLNFKSERKADYVNNLYTIADRGAVVRETVKKSLYEMLWKPIEKELSGVKTIYFSPSGLLHRINLGAIPISMSETLADIYQFIELNSSRQLVFPNQVKIINNEAVLYGGIKFDQENTFLLSETMVASRSIGEVSFDLVDTTLRGGSWNYLPGTEQEVNSIEKIMQNTGMQTNLKNGYEATEESLKKIGTNNTHSPKILHFSTHGYFFPDGNKEINISKLSFAGQEPAFKLSEHPLLRSGLIMAGGNAAWQGKQTLDGREDGILTAYEISQMNLSNTELVVLSACETGLGDINGNEGVYGLQRAFKIAGAKYLIMSLWQVPDKQTSLLMTTFYKKWLEDKMSIPDAFHAAQKELRQIGLDPYQWAGFVLVE